MRLLICAPTFAPQVGGAETWLRGVTSRLVERGHDVSVVTRAAATMYANTKVAICGPCTDDATSMAIPTWRVAHETARALRSIGSGPPIQCPMASATRAMAASASSDAQPNSSMRRLPKTIKATPAIASTAVAMPRIHSDVFSAICGRNQCNSIPRASGARNALAMSRVTTRASGPDSRPSSDPSSSIQAGTVTIARSEDVTTRLNT